MPKIINAIIISLISPRLIEVSKRLKVGFLNINSSNSGFVGALKGTESFFTISSLTNPFLAFSTIFSC